MIRNKNGNVRDQQRQKVYNWEREIIWGESVDSPFAKLHQISLKDCEKLVRKALIWWYRVGKPLPNGSPQPIHMPLVTKGREGSAATGSKFKISLPSWARVDGPILHETAHCIIDRQGLLADDGGHGPYFMRVYIELLGHYWKLNRSELVLSAILRGLKVYPMEKINRPKP